MSTVTGFHLEQGRTKHIYQNRHIDGCPLGCLHLAQGFAGSGGGLSGGKAGSILAVEISGAEAPARHAIPPVRYYGSHRRGPPDPFVGSAAQVRTWQHVSLLCCGESSACRLNSARERGHAVGRGISRRRGRPQQQVIELSLSQVEISVTSEQHTNTHGDITTWIYSRPGQARGCSINKLRII